MWQGSRQTPTPVFCPRSARLVPKATTNRSALWSLSRKARPKGTARSAQEYVAPLLVLSGREYAAVSFGELHAMICDALLGHRPKLVAEAWNPDGRVRLLFEDGSAHDVDGGTA